MERCASSPLLLTFFCVFALAGASAQPTGSGTAPTAASTQQAPPAQPKGCVAITAKASGADVLLARASYKDAERDYRAALAQDPGSGEAGLGVVRALLGQDRVAEAQAEAAAMLAAQPKSAAAEVASSEADYRAANIDSAYNHARAAAGDDPCEGRAAAALARLFDLNGNYAHAASFYEHAHRLRPTDEIIRRHWINSRPRKEMQEELARYLEGEHSLSEGAARSYSSELEYLKARRPGECRVVSKAQTATEKMQPVYGDDSRAEAYGLDVLFNNKKHRMQIDTGASGIVLTERAAHDLNLTPEYKTRTGGIGDEGDVNSYLTHVHSIRIGDVEVQDCLVEVIRNSKTTKLDVEGIIGMDVFSRWLVTLDYVHEQVRLAPLPGRPGAPAPTRLESDPLPSDEGDEEFTPHDRYIAPEMKSWLPVLRIGHNILLQSRTRDNQVHYLIMDTGASLTNLSLPLARAVGKLHDASEITIHGLSGTVKKVYTTDRIPLRVENVILPERFYYTYDMTSTSHDVGFEISGLLGLPTLQRLTITIDYRDNLLKIDYDPNHDMRRF